MTTPDSARARMERIAQVGSWEVDLPANRLVYSDQALGIHGLSRDEFDGTLSGAIALAHPEDRLRLTAAINATLYRGQPFAIDYRIVRPDGTVRYVHAEDEVVRDAAGRAVRAYGITQDITERKAAEIALARSEERLRGIYDGLPSGVFTVDSTGAVDSANPALARMLGFDTPAQLLADIRGVAGEIYAEPGARRRFRNELFASGSVQGFETRWRRRDGSVFPVSLSARLAPDAAAGDYSYIGLAEDISGRQRTEAALRESEQRYRSLVSAMSEGIVMQEADGAIVACNESAERILGLTREQMVGRTSHDARWQAVREDGSPFPGEEHPAMLALRSGVAQADVVMGIRKPDGSVSWISINSRPMTRPGETAPYAAVTTFHDITARRTIERVLREEQQRLELLADNVPAMIAYVDAEMRYRYTNRRYRIFYGGSDASVGGRTIGELLTPQAWSAARPYVQRALAGEAVSYAGERQLHDGTLRHVAVSLVPHRDAAGNVAGLYILALDTTAEHAAALSLLEQQRRLNLIADNVPAMIAYVDAAGRFGYANLQHRIFHTGSAASIEGRSTLEVLGETQLQAVRGHVARVLAGESVAFTDRRPAHDGTPTDLSISLVPHRGGDGAVLGYYALLIDITAQRRAESALRESEAGLRHAQDMARLAHVTVRPDGSYERWSEN